jgi:hypothetical protein
MGAVKNAFHDEICAMPDERDEGSIPPSKAMLEALSWLSKRGGDGCFDLNGVALAAGESAPHTRTTWNNLELIGLIEFYNPAGKGRGRLRLTDAGKARAA